MTLSVWRSRTKSAAAHSRAAGLVESQRRIGQTLDAFFREIAEVKAAMRAEGSLWDGPVLDPPVEAAFNEWQARGPKETRIELDRLGEAPMMDLPESDFA